MPSPSPPTKTALEQIAASVQRVEDLLAALPGDVARELRTRIGTLRGILLDQRPPALALVGRRGAGKSSLINALFGQRVAEVGHVKSQTGRGRWFDYTAASGTLSILDTRGLQEGSLPTEADDAKTPIESIVLELKKKAPDALVFVIKASEVDAAIDADLTALEKILAEIERVHRFRPPVICVLTHCDVLEPKATKLHDPASERTDDLDEKLRHVAAAERQIEDKLRARAAIAPHHVATVGISAYMSWRENGEMRSDERWHMTELSTELFKLLPNAGRGMFVRIARVRGLQEELAMTLTKAVAALCAGVAAIPIPVADLIPITSMQVSLIAGIAWLSGRTLDLKASSEFLTALGMNVGAAFVLREAARALVKYVFPGGGSVVSGAVAFAGTMALGAAARAYFIRGESIEDAKRAYATEKTEKSEKREKREKREKS